MARTYGFECHSVRSGCILKPPPGEAGTAAPRRLGRDALVRTLSATEEVAALLASRRWFTEVRHEAQKPGIGMCLAGGHLILLTLSAFVALGTTSPASAEAMFMEVPGRG